MKYLRTRFRLARWTWIRFKHEYSGLFSVNWWSCLLRYAYLKAIDKALGTREDYVSKTTLKRAIDAEEYHVRRIAAGSWRKPMPSPLIDKITRKSGKSDPRAFTTPVKGRFG